jgi:two-component sensor histidine kinase
VLLDQIIPDQLPFVTFFRAVILAAFFYGLAPAILVTGLSGIVSTFWSDPTGASPHIFYATAFLLFTTLSGVNVALVHYLRMALARIKTHEERLAFINRELQHRIKNLFSVTTSICRQTITSGRPVEEMMDRVTGRIMTIAAAQDLLSPTEAKGAELTSLIKSLVATLAPTPTRLEMEGPPTLLPAESTTPFALILHELTTNALKYGAWSVEAGKVSVKWRQEPAELVFCWREHDGPAIAPPLREGLGSSLIKSSLPGAKVAHDLKADGLACEIRLPNSA